MISGAVKRPESNQPIPSDACRVFKGQLFEVFQWEQQQYDGSVRTFEKLRRPDTVVVLPVTLNGKILTTVQKQPGRKTFCSLVGGRQEPNESVFDTALREMNEEIGYSCESLKFWFAVHPTTKIDWVVYFVIAKNCVQSGRPSADVGEEIALVEKSFEEFLELALDEAFVDVELVPKMLKAMISKGEFESLKGEIIG
jgi:ADP-ribose pyrophosphatase